MATFKMAVMYEGISAEDILEIEAKTPSEAKIKCEEIVRESKERVEYLARHNVYFSKMIKSCRLCPYDFRLEMLAVNELFGSLKDQV